MMEAWYLLVDIILPFQWAEHIFMKNALLAILMATPLFALLGTMIVNNRMAFFSDAIGHSALTGIAIGVLLGLDSPLLSMIAFSIILALAISAVKNISMNSHDTTIGIFSSTAVALGIVILSTSGGFSKYSGYLIGDLLSIAPKDIYLLALSFLITIALWVILFNKLFLSSINKSLAVSKKVNTALVELIFTLIIALVVTISIQWIGILIINSLLIIPAAAARNISINIRQYTLISVIISLLSGIIGLILSYYIGTATSATIVLITALIYFISFSFRSRTN